MIDGAAYRHLNVHTEEDGAVVVLRFEHGKANEVGSAVLGEVERLATALRADAAARALVSYSARRSSRGTPVFVAGADVTERVGWDDDTVKRHVRWQRGVLAALSDVPMLHVVVVDGVAFGWGTEYLLTGDYRVACDGARFALPETGLGIVPGAGGTAWLADEIGLANALRLGMTGEVIDADEALRLGLVQERVASLDEGMVRARVLARAAATRSPTANAAFKAAARASRGLPAAARAAAEDAAYTRCVDTGEAARGRASFESARRGDPVAWGPRVLHDDP